MKLQYNDRQHAYYLDGKRLKSVTAVAKVPDDTFALQAWGKRMVAIGVAANPALVDQVAAHADDRDKLDAIVEEAMVWARAHAGAARGTATHSITEKVDAGATLLDTGLTRLVREQWTGLLAEHDISIVMSERIVVWPEHGIAGRFDRIVRWRGGLFVLDIKTGKVDYPHSMAVQLAAYACAPLVAGELDAQGCTTEFDALPAGLDTGVGLIAHMPADGAQSLHTVDIAAGAEVWRSICLPTLAWRKRTGLLQPVTADSASVAAVPASAIRDRLAWIKEHTPAALAAIAAQWPAGVPTPKQADAYTPAQADTLNDLIGRIESTHETPFGPLPHKQHTEQPTPPQPRPIGAASRALHDATIDTLRALPSHHLAAVEPWCKERGVPNLRTYSATPDQLRLVLERAATALTDELEDMAEPVLAFCGWDGPTPTNCMRLIDTVKRLGTDLVATVGDDGATHLTDPTTKEKTA